jgi:hypothetical protein
VQQHLIEVITAHNVQMLVFVSVDLLDAVDDGRFPIAPGRPEHVHWRGVRHPGALIVR